MQQEKGKLTRLNTTAFEVYPLQSDSISEGEDVQSEIDRFLERTGDPQEMTIDEGEGPDEATPRAIAMRGITVEDGALPDWLAPARMDEATEETAEPQEPQAQPAPEIERPRMQYTGVSGYYGAQRRDYRGYTRSSARRGKKGPVRSRATAPSARRGISRGGEKSDEDRQLNKIMIKVGVCAAVVLVVLVAKAIDQPWSRQAMSTFKQTIEAPLKLDETIGQLRFVENIFPDAVSVFSGMESAALPEDVPTLAAPAAGKITARFIEGRNEGIDIAGQDTGDVLAAADGTVTELGQDATRGAYVKIDHGDELETVYYQLKDIAVAEGDAVTQHQKIATIAHTGEQAVLHFELRYQGRAFDPLPHIDDTEKTQDAGGV